MVIEIKKHNIFKKNILVIAILALIFYVSVWQGYYRIDPHHWGLMLGSAKDMLEGKLPYKDIYNIYGILTTIAHTIAVKIIEINFSSIIKITALFYIAGLWVIYKINYKLTNDFLSSNLVLIICALIHPVVIYPWSNYIAFPFIMGGIYFLLFNENKKLNFFGAGLMFALAVLSREGVAPVIGLIVVLFFFVDALNRIKIRELIRQGFYLFVGLIIPILIFAIYLIKYDLIKYWKILSIQLPKVYASGQFTHMSSVKILNPFIMELQNGIISLDIRWISIVLMLIVMTLGLLYTIIYRNGIDDNRLSIIKISFASFALTITTLHIPEIFRISTGCIIGLIALFYWFKLIKIDRILFILLFIPLTATLFETSSGNPFYPDKEVRSKAIDIKQPSVISMQRWPKEYEIYYQDFMNTMFEIQKLPCAIAYHYNDTMDTMLYILSPFRREQLTPYSHPLFDFLRPDLDYKEKIKQAKDLIIFKLSSKEDFSDITIPNNYIEYKKIKTNETQWVYTKNQYLIILIPKICSK